MPAIRFPQNNSNNPHSGCLTGLRRILKELMISEKTIQSIGLVLIIFFYSTFGPIFTYILQLIILPLLGYYLLNVSYPELSPEDNHNVHLTMTITVFTLQMYIFEFITVSQLEITVLENYSLLALVLIPALYFCYLRRNNCQSQSLKIDYCFYEPWLAIFIEPKQWLFYVLSLCSLMCGSVFYMYLSLSTVCTTEDWGPLLIPVDCQDIYFDYSTSLCFISSISCLTIIATLATILYKRTFRSRKPSDEYSYSILRA